MKKIIATIIRVIMPKAVSEHERNKRIHNANVLQHLLDAEHDLKNRINNMNNTVYTTKKAIEIANKTNFCNYNSVRSLKEADFHWYVVEMNENVDGTGSPAITLHSLYLYNNTYNKLDDAQIAQLCALNSLLNFISLL